MVRIKHFLATLILFSLTLCFMVKAFASEEIVFSEEFIVNKDGNAMYSVNVTKNSNIAGLSLTVSYDKDKLTLLDAYVGEGFSSSINSVNKKKAGIVYMSSVSTVPVTESGSIITLVFDGKSTANISFSVSECIDEYMHNLGFRIQNTETDTAQPNETTRNPIQSSSSSKLDSYQNSTGNSEEEATDTSKNSSDKSQSQSQYASETSSNVASNRSESSQPQVQNGSSATIQGGTLEKKEDSVNFSEKKTSDDSTLISKNTTADSATKDESNQSSNYIIWIIVSVVLCIVVITISIIYKKRRMTHEK